MPKRPFDVRKVEFRDILLSKFCAIFSDDTLTPFFQRIAIGKCPETLHRLSASESLKLISINGLADTSQSEVAEQSNHIDDQSTLLKGSYNLEHRSGYIGAYLKRVHKTGINCIFNGVVDWQT